MQKGFAILIGLLIGALVFIFLAMAIFKTFTKGYIAPTETQTIEDKAQDAVKNYQLKGIENQTPELDLGN